MAKVKSILFITYHFPPEVGGIQTRISRYISNLRAMNRKISVLYLRSSGETTKNVVDGADVLACSGRIRFTFQNFKRIVRIISRNHADVIHVFSGGTTLIGILSLGIGRLMGISSVFSFFGIEGIVFESFSEKARFILSATFATAIATNSSAMKILVPPRFRSKTRTILGGSDLAPRMGETSFREPIVLSVGRLVKSKGFDDVLRAFSILRQSVPIAKLVIVGDGPEALSLRNSANSLGLQQSVEFKGILKGKTLQNEYERSSVFVLASKRVKEDPATEAFGLVLVEAAMHAKPLIGTRIGGIPEIVRDGENGILVSQNNPEELARAMIKLLSDRQLNLKMGKNSLEIAKTNFTWDASTVRLLRCYED